MADSPRASITSVTEPRKNPWYANNPSTTTSNATAEATHRRLAGVGSPTSRARAAAVATSPFTTAEATISRAKRTSTQAQK